MSWKNALTASQVEFMQSIVDQVPEVMGARAAFEAILDNLAKVTKSFVIVDEDGDELETTASAEEVLSWLEGSKYVVTDVTEEAGDNVVHVEERA